jgi:hypothetical protein
MAGYVLRIMILFFLLSCVEWIEREQFLHFYCSHLVRILWQWIIEYIEQFLYADDNLLSGSVPTEIGLLTRLAWISLGMFAVGMDFAYSVDVNSSLITKQYGSLLFVVVSLQRISG